MMSHRPQPRRNSFSAACRLALPGAPDQTLVHAPHDLAAVRQDIHPAQDAHDTEGLTEGKVLSQQGRTRTTPTSGMILGKMAACPAPRPCPHVPEDHGAHAAYPDDMDHAGQGRAAHAVHVQLPGQRGIEDYPPSRTARLGGEEQQVPLLKRCAAVRLSAPCWAILLNATPVMPMSSRAK